MSQWQDLASHAERVPSTSPADREGIVLSFPNLPNRGDVYRANQASTVKTDFSGKVQSLLSNPLIKYLNQQGIMT